MAFLAGKAISKTPIHFTVSGSFEKSTLVVKGSGYKTFCASLHEENCKLAFSKMVDEVTKKTVASIPTLKTKAGPRDSDAWVQRLKEEYTSLIKVAKCFIVGTA